MTQKDRLHAFHRARAREESAELRAWAATAFRPAKLHGSPAAMRYAAKGKIAPPTVGELIGLVGVLATSFFAGRWLARRHANHAATYMRGVDFASAPAP